MKTKYRISRFLFTIGLIYGISFFNLAVAQQNQEPKFFVKTSSDILFVDINEADGLVNPSLNISIQNEKNDHILWKGLLKSERNEGKIKFQTENLNPELWAPSSPVLYHLNLSLLEKGKEIINYSCRIGFRDFDSHNGQLFLNGHPIFLRGIAINPPGRGIPKEVEESREFALDYVQFMKKMNVNIIRIPDNETWYEVCDELGMMVFGGNYSGSVDGETPPKDYDKGVSWYENEKFQPIMHHPSLMIYALTNEVPYTGKKAQEWIDFLSYAHNKLKEWDNTRLYIGNAGYGYGQSGDICDLHRYWGWYYASPFTFLNIRDYNKITFPEKIQPLTFTECVGNYTGPDGRYNLTPNHKNPVSQLNWTGHAPQNEQAMLADQHQSFVFKQVTELMRRLRRINPESSGVFPFTILFRNWHTVRQFSDMGPKPVTDQVKLSYQPVLVSWENWQSKVYAGAAFNPIAHIINDADDFSSLHNISLIVRILDKAYTVWVADTIKIPDLPYYKIHSQKIDIGLPENMFTGEYKLEGTLFADGKEVSRNFDPLFIESAGKFRIQPGYKVQLFDPERQTLKAFQKNDIPFNELKNLSELNPAECLVIGENAAGKELSDNAPLLREFVRRGGRMLILGQDSARQKYLEGVLPVEVQFPRMNIDDPSYPPPPRPSFNSFNVNPERSDHPVFSGIDRSRLREWSDYTSWDETEKGFPAIYPVNNGFIIRNKKDIEKTAVLADYSVGLEGIALAEFFDGKGSVMLSGFDLCNRAGIDPVADRLLVNCINYMADKSIHQKYVLIKSPILWGEYETEKGILTGINSGFMLNSKPALFGSYERLPLILQKDGHLFAEKGGGWNNAAGKEYVPYGRRMFGPYSHRDFGGVPTPDDPDSSEGEGFFWCRVPEGTGFMKTLVWNPAKEQVKINIEINDQPVSNETIAAGEYKWIESKIADPANSLKIDLKGDRRLVILQTSFN